jgi:hypothetical protein
MLSHVRARAEIGCSHSGRGSFRVTLAAFVALALPHVATAAGGDFRVLHHQAVQITSRAQVGAQEHVSFDAYGRRFELTVAPNERIRRALPAANTTTMPLQGTVDGIKSSWVRITRSTGGWRGMIFDGQSLYAIEPAADIADAVVEPLTVSGSAPVVYRLDDALLPIDQMSCEIVHADAPATAAQAFTNLSHELQAQAATAELSASKQVRVGVVGDFEFANLFAGGTLGTPEEAVIARMNIVDGIFTSQLGVKMSLAPTKIFSNADDPFSKSVAGDLLTELRTYRGGSAAQLALGLTHLMTGRDLQGDTVGIAYIGSVCDGQNAASLSEGRRGTMQSALIAAHEIGHNFGAPHDGETGACQSTPQTFLMAPRLNGSDQFSACSVAQIQPYINNSRCLTAYDPPDAALNIGTTSMPAQTGTAFVVSFLVQALGDDASSSVSVTATLPTSITIASATANGGTCTTGAGTATCSLGTLPAGDTRQVDMNLTATESGSLSMSLRVDSANDANSGNDAGTITIAASGNPVTKPNPPTTGGSTSGGGGGGGRVDLVLLVLLFGTLVLRRRLDCAGYPCLAPADDEGRRPPPKPRHLHLIEPKRALFRRTSLPIEARPR